jgi:hypothetical protein
VLNGSGVAGFVVLLEGLKSIRQQRGSDEPIRVRRLIHPDEPGSNYSYGIQHGGWTPEKGGTLNGWAVFVRVATDYSGFGSRQHSQIENLLERLSTEGVIDIKEFEVPEDTLQDYLDDQAIQKRYTRDEDHRFDGRSLDRIIADGEGTRTEFKEEFPNSTTDAGKEIAAFANYNGGVVIFGIDDDGQVLGLEEPEKVENQISGILWEMMEPPLSADLHLIMYEDEPILVVEIPDADNPVGCKFIYYFRNGTNVRKLSYSELKRRFG